jgi:DNA polymerase III delta subunit
MWRKYSTIKRKSFDLNNAARVLSRISTKTAGDILLILEQTDLSLKRKVMDEQWIIEQAMAKILLAIR